MGPGVTPILFWQGAAPGPFDPTLDAVREPGAAFDLHEREVPPYQAEAPAQTC